MRTVYFAALILLLSVSAGFGQVRTWVSPTGLDTNPCTREQPCRNFAAAITAVAAGGEVVALESAGYGPVTITKSVTIVAPAGVHAAIAPSSGVAITVSAADTDHVVLRNLYLNAQGASVGIDANTVAALYVESCVVSGFSTYGILFDPTTTSARLYVSDGIVRRSETGIFAVGSGRRAVIDSARLHHNATAGVWVSDAEATVRQSVASGASAGSGFYATASATKLMVEDSLSTTSGRGFLAQFGAKLTVTRCAATSNTVGIRAESTGSTIYVSDSTVVANGTGVSTDATGVVTSRGNNTVQANTTNGSFTSTFTPN